MKNSKAKVLRELFSTACFPKASAKTSIFLYRLLVQYEERVLQQKKEVLKNEFNSSNSKIKSS
jgi:hypothetical protein